MYLVSLAPILCWLCCTFAVFVVLLMLAVELPSARSGTRRLRAEGAVVRRACCKNTLSARVLALGSGPRRSSAHRSDSGVNLVLWLSTGFSLFPIDCKPKRSGQSTVGEPKARTYCILPRTK